MSLARAPDGGVTVLGHADEAGVGLDVALVDHRRGEFALDDQVGFREAGVEVAVTFINGDPDRPVIAGAIPNEVTRSPTIDENHNRNIVRTRSGILLELADGHSE